jgi:hypothetical protein
MNPLDKYLAKREAAEHPPPLPRSYKQKVVATVGRFCLIAIIILAGLFGLAIATVAAKLIAKYTFDLAVYRAELRQAAAANQPWKRQTIAGLSLESPYDFGTKGAGVRPALPPRVRRIKMYVNNRPTDDNMFIGVTAAEYVGIVDLDGALHLAVVNGVKVINDNDPQYTTSLAESGGKVAHYRGGVNMDVLVIARANKLWMVNICFFDAPQDLESSRRIIQSVRLIE